MAAGIFLLEWSEHLTNSATGEDFTETEWLDLCARAGAEIGASMPFEDRVRYMEKGTGQVFYLWRDEDESDWVVGMFTGGPSGVEITRRFESQSSAQEFLAGLKCQQS